MGTEVIREIPLQYLYIWSCVGVVTYKTGFGLMIGFIDTLYTPLETTGN
jgi:hypothetical protein